MLSPCIRYMYVLQPSNFLPYTNLYGPDYCRNTTQGGNIYETAFIYPSHHHFLEMYSQSDCSFGGMACTVLMSCSQPFMEGISTTLSESALYFHWIICTLQMSYTILLLLRHCRLQHIVQTGTRIPYNIHRKSTVWTARNRSVGQHALSVQPVQCLLVWKASYPKAPDHKIEWMLDLAVPSSQTLFQCQAGQDPCRTSTKMPQI